MDTSIGEIPLISVIVPIYNVERYVRKCLDSLKNQTMKQIEVICIDDGSTDESGSIAEEYKNEEGWPRFRAIHTENRGLSAARNRGIDEAKADWIMFVDSDDWVEPGFCEIPYKAAVENAADIVVFGGIEEKRWKKKSILNVVASVGIIDEFTVYKYGRGFAWNKLYTKRLFETIRYPEGRVFEDGATTHILVHMAREKILLHDCLYHYTYRKDSITQTHTEQSTKDRFISYFEESSNLLMWGYTEERRKAILIGYAIDYLSVSTHVDDEEYKKAIDIVDSIEEIPKLLSLRKKIAITIWKTNPDLFDVGCKIIGRKRIGYDKD